MKRPLNLKSLPKPAFDYESFNSWQKPSAALAIEIGCGVGFHPIQWAKENPSSQLLAIERTKEKFKKFKHRLSHHPQIQNVWPAHAEATLLLPALLNLKPVDTYFLLYPNPEPKKKHIRWANHAFMQFLVATLKKGGRIDFATNIASYADEMRTVLPVKYGLKITQDATLSSATLPRTHFEKKYLARGEACWNLVFTKI